MPHDDRRNESDFGAAMQCVARAVVEGLHHGFFTVTITGEIGKKGGRCLTIEAGKSQRFTIREEDLPK